MIKVFNFHKVLTLANQYYFFQISYIFTQWKELYSFHNYFCGRSLLFLIWKGLKFAIVLPECHDQI